MHRDAPRGVPGGIDDTDILSRRAPKCPSRPRTTTTSRSRAVVDFSLPARRRASRRARRARVGFRATVSARARATWRVATRRFGRTPGAARR